MTPPQHYSAWQFLN